MIPQNKPVLLISGAGGYIGRPTVNTLVSQGYEVHIIGRSDPKIDGTAFHQIDLLVESDLNAKISDISATHLIHLAWSVTPGKFWTDLANCDWVGASLRLFQAFTNAGGQRILGIGSCAEYDWQAASHFAENNSPIDPKTLYGQAKACTWSMLEAIGRQEGLSVAWARIFFLYGPGEPRGKLVSDAINTLQAGQTFATTPGLQKRDFIHVEDAGRALATLALSSVSGPVNIASGESVTVRNMLEQIALTVAADAVIDFGARPFPSSEPMDLRADISRLSHEVGFKPKWSLSEGIHQTVDWWRNQILIKSSAV